MTLTLRNIAMGVIQTVKRLIELCYAADRVLEYRTAGKGYQPIRFENQKELLCCVRVQYICLYTCIYVCIYVYTHTHTHTNYVILTGFHCKMCHNNVINSLRFKKSCCKFIQFDLS